MDTPLLDEIRDAIHSCDRSAEITDLHLWRVGKGKYSCIVSLSADGKTMPDDFRRALVTHPELVHITVEINPPEIRRIVKESGRVI
jgi:Co/Zn/Cd efflux system component